MRGGWIVALCALLLGCLRASAHDDRDAFLARRAADFTAARLDFPDSIRIWAFGALHGSAKTERAELLLLEKLLARRDTVWYFPETDYATAHYFESYLRSGGDSLLKELVIRYGRRVPQERSVEVYEKWRRLRLLTRGKRFRIVGLDPVCSPDFAVRYLLDSMRDAAWPFRGRLERLAGADGTLKDGESAALFAEVAADYARRLDYYAGKVGDTAAFGYVIRDLGRMGEPRERGMVRNYCELDARFGFRRGVQFVRMGVGHILKEREDGWEPFICRLVAEGLYRPAELCTVQAFFTRSRVLWDEKFDAAGRYAGHTTKGGWGLSDSWRERFRGLRRLKRNRRGEMTYFDLRGADSPFVEAGCLDLVVCRRLFGPQEKCPDGAATCDYLDAALLIGDSPAARPIFEMEDN